MSTLSSGAIHAAIALILCAASASATPAPPTGEGPFAECHLGQTDAVNTMIVCRNWLANTARMPAEDQVWDTMVSTFLTGFALGSDGGVSEERQPVTLGGRAFVMATVTVGDESAPTMRGVVAWPAEPQSILEAHSCLVSARDPDGTARCPTVLEALATTGVPEDLPTIDPQQPAIVGRPIPHDPACQAHHDPFRGMIDCMPMGGGAVDWMQMEVAATPEELEMLQSGTLGNLKMMSPGEWAVADTDCTLEGAQARCWQYTQQSTEGPARQVLLAYGGFRGIPLLAKCVYKGEASQLPEPCGGILGF